MERPGRADPGIAWVGLPADDDAVRGGHLPGLGVGDVHRFRFEFGAWQ